jgi:hypothetical protein
MPEPIFSETVTDIDATEAGELELSADSSELRSRRAGSQLFLAGVEAEWLATSHLGLRAEPEFARTAGPDFDSHTDFGVGTTLSWKLVTDVVHDFFMQAEAGAELPPRSERYPSPDQAGLPYTLDLKAGLRRGTWTLRGSVGAGAGSPSPHVPLNASLALLMEFDHSASACFVGIEALADGTWPSPLSVAPDIMADLAAIGLPVRLGVALPWSPGASDTQPSFGIYVRLMVEPRRDIQSGVR